MWSMTYSYQAHTAPLPERLILTFRQHLAESTSPLRDHTRPLPGQLILTLEAQALKRVSAAPLQLNWPVFRLQSRADSSSAALFPPNWRTFRRQSPANISWAGLYPPNCQISRRPLQANAEPTVFFPPNWPVSRGSLRAVAGSRAPSPQHWRRSQYPARGITSSMSGGGLSRPPGSPMRRCPDEGTVSPRYSLSKPRRGLRGSVFPGVWDGPWPDPYRLLSETLRPFLTCPSSLGHMVRRSRWLSPVRSCPSARSLFQRLRHGRGLCILQSRARRGGFISCFVRPRPPSPIERRRNWPEPSAGSPIGESLPAAPRKLGYRGNRQTCLYSSGRLLHLPSLLSLRNPLSHTGETPISIWSACLQPGEAMCRFISPRFAEGAGGLGS